MQLKKRERKKKGKLNEIEKDHLLDRDDRRRLDDGDSQPQNQTPQTSGESREETMKEETNDGKKVKK